MARGSGMWNRHLFHCPLSLSLSAGAAVNGRTGSAVAAPHGGGGLRNRTPLVAPGRGVRGARHRIAHWIMDSAFAAFVKTGPPPVA
eukprot:3404599-Prymnesium_polylepis.1